MPWVDERVIAMGPEPGIAFRWKLPDAGSWGARHLAHMSGSRHSTKTTVVALQARHGIRRKREPSMQEPPFCQTDLLRHSKRSASGGNDSHEHSPANAAAHDVADDRNEVGIASPVCDAEHLKKKPA